MRIALAAAAIVVGVLVCAFATLGVSAQTAAPDDPLKVVDAFDQARGSGNLDAALAEFADDAIVTLQGPSLISYRGKDQVRNYLHSFGVHFQTMTRTGQVVQGNTVTWTEHNELEHHAWDTTVLAVVRSGHIASLWYRVSDPGAGPTPSAVIGLERRPGELPAATWAAGLALVGLLLLGVVFRRPRRTAPQSQLDGRLLLALQRRRRGFERRRTAA
jgi:hypothetical protein